MVTVAVSFTVSRIQAALMLKTTFLPTPLVFDLEFEGHAVGIWRRNWRRKLESTCKEIMIVECRLNHVGTVHDCDRRTERQIYDDLRPRYA